MKFIEIASKYIIIGEENVPLTKCGNERMTIQVSELTDNARLYNKQGRWFKDSKGRYVLFRGVNFGSRSKLAPFLPIAPLNARCQRPRFEKEIETVKPELDLLKQLGFNFIRLLISWKAIEPRPNPTWRRSCPRGGVILVM